MKYEYWPGAMRICTVSEPFLTPVVQHVLNTMGGIGVPDYQRAYEGYSEENPRRFQRRARRCRGRTCRAAGTAR
jgi:hypothetical protein